MTGARGKNIGPACMFCGFLLGLVAMGIVYATTPVPAAAPPKSVRKTLVIDCVWSGSDFDCKRAS